MIAPGLHSRCPSRARQESTPPGFLSPAYPLHVPQWSDYFLPLPLLWGNPCPTDLLYPLLLCLSPASPSPSDARQLRLLPLSSLGLTLGATLAPTPRWAHSWHLLFAEQTRDSSGSVSQAEGALMVGVFPVPGPSSAPWCPDLPRSHSSLARKAPLCPLYKRGDQLLWNLA